MDEISTSGTPASRHALALIRFPDPRTDWVVVTVATLSQPIDDLESRIDELHRGVPIIGARLNGESWFPGEPPTVLEVEGDPLGHVELDRPFDLAREAPLRLLIDRSGLRLGIAGHHAAFDGLALVAVLRALCGGDQPRSVESPPPGEAGSKLPLLNRLARPADPVAPTRGHWPGDAYASELLELTGSGITGRIAAAATMAAAAHNRVQGERLRKVGLTIAIGGPAGIGNVASYRRIDTTPGSPIAKEVQTALGSADEPGEQVSAPKALMALLAPVVERFSDTLLISNLGRHRVPGVESLQFFPVARGRSAVCIASAAIEGGKTTLTLRARDLSPGDGRAFLHAVTDALT